MSKPFLKWAGGKYKLVPFIETHIPTKKRKRLIEPFSGSAALSLSLDFDRYLLNDINTDLIVLFSNLKTEKHSFIDYAHSFFIPENNNEKKYYDLRDRFNHSTDTIERAALFVYLNRHAFNGLCRYNSKGCFNVPFGRYKSPYFPETEMQAFVQKSERIDLTCSDFQTALDAAEDGDTIYCDPPYAPLSETSSFTSYSKSGFDLDEQKRLAETAKQTARRAHGILISNHDTTFTREIYRGAVIKTVEVQRSIAAKGSSRKKVGELLAIYE